MIQYSRFLLQTLMILLIMNNIIYAESGSIFGEIVDIDTHQPLPGANIIIKSLDKGVGADNNGFFQINNIPVGSYTITVSMIGYSKVSRTNVNIYSNRQTPLKFYLSPQVLKGNEVIVQSNYFGKAKDGIVSTQTIDREEIRSDPVGIYDVQMMIHNLPSLVTATDQSNEIIVRGGGPGENLFIMDHLEIPNPNHFGDVATGGGPVNILNTEFVERIDFFAGGFSSRYGDKQSSVMDIKLREGNYENFELDAELSMAGFGFLTEGPFLNGKGSFISSYRKSFLKYFIKSAGLTSVPEYWNTQHKITYNINDKNKLIFNFVGGSDEVNIEGEDRPELKGAENVNYLGYQYTTGLTYKSLFSSKGYSLISIGKTISNWNANAYEIDNNKNNIFFQRDNTESDIFLKADLVYKLNSKLEFSFGINGKYGQYDMLESLKPDTVFQYNYSDLENMDMISLLNYNSYYDLASNKPEYIDKINNYEISDTILINSGFENDNNGGIEKYAGYFQLKYIWKSLTFTGGFRYDNVPYNNTSKIAPRFGTSLSLSPITKINIAFGRYYQTPYYWIFMNPVNDSILKHSFSEQAVIGLEHYFDNDIKMSLEFYKKEYFNRPIPKSNITPEPYDNFLGFVDVGEGRSEGIELFLQKKFTDKWHGTFSFSHSVSETKDYRSDKNDYFPSDYDRRNGLTVVGGYKIKFRELNWYNDIKKSAIFPFIAWFPIMFSDNLEISFRYRYSDGLPYTSKKYNYLVRKWYVDSNQDINNDRSDYYSRLDLMILRRFNFKNINITTFLDIQNIFNRDNEWEKVYLEDGTYTMSYQYKQTPIMGLIIEF